jgi:hypothetical protein
MRTLGASGEARVVRGIVGAVALLLGAYCLLAAATALSAPPGQPDPGELAARERYQWPGWIPVVFLALLALYALTVAARQWRRRRGEPRLPSTADPPLASSGHRRNGDAGSP